MSHDVTFTIRETVENGHTVFEVWRRHHRNSTECLLAEANTRAEAREIMQHYAGLESPPRFSDEEMKWINEGASQQMRGL